MKGLRKRYRKEKGISEPQNIMSAFSTHQEDKDYIEWLEKEVIDTHNTTDWSILENAGLDTKLKTWEQEPSKDIAPTDMVENIWEYLNSYISSIYSDCSSVPELMDGFGVRKDGQNLGRWEAIRDGLSSFAQQENNREWISVDRIDKFARMQHYLGTQNRKFVPFEDWRMENQTITITT